MTSARIYALACISLAVLTACGKDEVAPAQHAAAEAPSNESFDMADVATREIHLADEIVDPDANEPLASDDEDAIDVPAATPADSIVLADTPGEVTFRTMQTSSLRATHAQAMFADELARHNREARRQAELGSPEPAAPDANASSSNAAIAASSTPAAQDSKPPTQPAAPIDEKKILADPLGQWASSATASSTYAQTTGDKAGYSAWQATGTPNVSRYSDDPAAWTSKSGDSKAPEWLEVKFAKAVYATGLRIRQSAAPGAISKLELLDADGASHEIWSGTDTTPYEKNTIGWLVQEFPKTSFVVTGARITLATARVWGWNEIDAVQLVGEP
ncbi:hypothetical protein [Steroidobacter agaridevorans]|uniref:hypothetical protein n=1 Tax=Steroidobacter agaridevorans TaxID=2695856 RepID=UPI001324E1FD|nr:hypothetical protein [Steroidobacter agaridevorans]GFE85972.1 hypothetical protein GCM10011488_09260 [Steroidobacter agaridevorans]